MGENGGEFLLQIYLKLDINFVSISMKHESPINVIWFISQNHYLLSKFSSNSILWITTRICSKTVRNLSHRNFVGTEK